MTRLPILFLLLGLLGAANPAVAGGSEDDSSCEIIIESTGQTAIIVESTGETTPTAVGGGHGDGLSEWWAWYLEMMRRRWLEMMGVLPRA